MKKIVAVLTAVLISAAAVRAQEAKSEHGTPPPPAAPAVTEPATKDWKVEVGADYCSEYIFRGVDVSHNNPLAQDHLLVGYKGFTATYYGYYSPVDVPGLGWYTEHDYTLDYTITLKKFTITAGALYYQYPNGRSGVDTWDLYTVAAYDFPLLNPKATLNWDVDEFGTGYGTVGISHVFDLTKTVGLKDPMTLSITPSAALGIDFGYNSKKTQSNIDWNDVLLGVSVNLGITKNVSVHAGVQCSIALNSLSNINQGDEVIGNVGVAVAF